MQGSKVGSAGLAASLAFPATGQGLRPLPHVSFLSHSSPEEWGSRLAEFRAELRALGYVEGRDVIVETWWAEDRLERVPALIAEMMSSKPTVIVTHGSPNVAAMSSQSRLCGQMVMSALCAVHPPSVPARG